MKKPAIALLYLFSIIKLSFAQQAVPVKTPKAVLDDFIRAGNLTWHRNWLEPQ
jgi:alpha-L-fucosidase